MLPKIAPWVVAFLGGDATFNIYNITTGGQVLTQYMHITAGFLIALTIDLFFITMKFYKEAFFSLTLFMGVSLVWEIVEYLYGFKGDHWDTLMDLAGGYGGSLGCILLLKIIDVVHPISSEGEA